MALYYVHHNGAAAFAKEALFFQEQRRNDPSWDTSAWRGPINADGPSHARMLCEQMAQQGEFRKPQAGGEAY